MRGPIFALPLRCPRGCGDPSPSPPASRHSRAEPAPRAYEGGNTSEPVDTSHPLPINHPLPCPRVCGDPSPSPPASRHSRAEPGPRAYEGGNTSEPVDTSHPLPICHPSFVLAYAGTHPLLPLRLVILAQSLAPVHTRAGIHRSRSTLPIPYPSVTPPLSSRMRGPIPFSPCVSSFPRRACPPCIRGREYIGAGRHFPSLTHQSPPPLSSRMRGPIPFSPFRHSRSGPAPREDPLYVFPRRREPNPHPSVIPAKSLSSCHDTGAGNQGWGIVPPIIKTLAASPKQAFALQGEK